MRHSRINPSSGRPRRSKHPWFTITLALVILGAAVAIGLPMTMSRYHRAASAASVGSLEARQRADKSAAKSSVSSERSTPKLSASSHPLIPAKARDRSGTHSSGTSAACGPIYTHRSKSWPNCSDTGARGSLVRRFGDLTITRNGAVINHVFLRGSLDIHANNVTVENSVIDSSNWWGIFQRPGHRGLKVLHDTITGVVGKGPDSGGEDIGVWNLGGSIRIAYDNISEFGGNVDIITGYVHDNYIHSEQAFGSEGISGCDPMPHPVPMRCYNHSNAFGIDSGHNITLQHNTILQASIPGADSAVELDDDLGTISHVEVTDNFIAGGNFCTYAASSPSLAPSTYIVYTENAFSEIYYANCGYYGPDAYWSFRGRGNKWSGNYWVSGRRSGRRVIP